MLINVCDLCGEIIPKGQGYHLSQGDEFYDKVLRDIAICDNCMERTHNKVREIRDYVEAQITDLKKEIKVITK